MKPRSVMINTGNPTTEMTRNTISIHVNPKIADVTMYRVTPNWVSSTFNTEKTIRITIYDIAPE